MYHAHVITGVTVFGFYIETDCTELVAEPVGTSAQGMKEDFIVVHLREPCSFCRKYISGSMRCALCPPLARRWVKASRPSVTARLGEVSYTFSVVST